MQSPISSPLLKNMCPSFCNTPTVPVHTEAEEDPFPARSSHEIYAFIALSLDKTFQGDYEKMEEYMLEVWRENNLRDLESGLSVRRTLPFTAAQMKILCRNSQPSRESILADVKEQQELLTEQQRNDALKVRFERLVDGKCTGLAEQALELWKDYHRFKGSQDGCTDKEERDMGKSQEPDGFFSRLFYAIVPSREKTVPIDLESLKSASHNTSGAPDEKDEKPKYWMIDDSSRLQRKAPSRARRGDPRTWKTMTREMAERTRTVL
ncbi:MAG: hypothetical protein Q9174_004407 [Haloplaca sp. 1 TL-2023]